MSAGVIFQQMVVIFLLILVGYVLFKWKILAFSCSADLSALVVQLCSPALIIVSALEGCHNLKHDQVIWGFVLVGGLYTAVDTFRSSDSRASSLTWLPVSAVQYDDGFREHRLYRNSGGHGGFRRGCNGLCDDFQHLF